MVKSVRTKKSSKKSTARSTSRKKAVNVRKSKTTSKQKPRRASKKISVGEKKLESKKTVKKPKTVSKKPVKKLSSSKNSAVTGPMGVKPYQPKKGEEYMSDAQLKHFCKILNAWKDQLLEEFSQTKRHIQQETANRPDPVDRASQETDFNLELRARDRERKLLKKIDEALHRIEDHSYGYCDDCGNEIGVRRLEARPTATLCIECKTIAELREKQIGELEQG